MSEPKKPTVLLEHYLKKLKLPTMLREYASMAAVCRDDRSDYPTYLLRLTERELLDRETRAAERRVKDARFPVTKTIDTFDFKAQPSINEPLIRELLRGEFIDKRENVLLIGNSGTGKTHLAISLGICACRQGKRVRFYTAAELINDLLEAQAQLRLGKLETSLTRYDVIVLDELGFVPFTKEGAEALFTFFSGRYERGSMIVTTNLDFARWKEIFGDEALTGALLDRLTHRCHIIEMNGDSYRFKENLKRRTKA